jgi:uncharacterized protein YbjT (DUF2867 family)
MKIRMWLGVAAAAVAAGLVSGSAGAAPAGASVNAAVASTVAALASAGVPSDDLRRAGWSGQGRRHYYAPRYRYLDWKHRYFRQGFRSYFAPAFQPMFRRL